MCYRTGKYTVCRRLRVSFSTEILQAEAAKGLIDILFGRAESNRRPRQHPVSQYHMTGPNPRTDLFLGGRGRGGGDILLLSFSEFKLIFPELIPTARIKLHGHLHQRTTDPRDKLIIPEGGTSEVTSICMQCSQSITHPYPPSLPSLQPLHPTPDSVVVACMHSLTTTTITATTTTTAAAQPQPTTAGSASGALVNSRLPSQRACCAGRSRRASCQWRMVHTFRSAISRCDRC